MYYVYCIRYWMMPVLFIVMYYQVLEDARIMYQYWVYCIRYWRMPVLCIIMYYQVLEDARIMYYHVLLGIGGCSYYVGENGTQRSLWL